MSSMSGSKDELDTLDELINMFNKLDELKSMYDKVGKLNE